MSKLLRWLRGDLYRAKVGEREIAAKRWHGLSVIGIVIAVILILVLGVFIGYSYPYKTVAPPPVPPGQTLPSCTDHPSQKHSFAKSHGMGSCLPQKTSKTGSLNFEFAAAITSTQIGPDLSNNDPILGDGPWSIIGAHNAFAIFKVNQGTYYTDRTAKPMADYARRHGITVGGYDFADVCHSPAQDEAAVFVGLLRVDGLLTGRNVLRPTGDMEYPVGSLSCNARSWIITWVVTVHNLTGLWPMIYTGAWWWNPHIGCYWPGNSISWISGYASLSFILSSAMPCGLSHLDNWQYSDAGSNGYNRTDMSIWRAGAPAFIQASNGTPPGPSPALTRSRIAARGRSLHAFYQHGCRQPVLTSGTCGQLAWRVDHYQKLVDTAHGYYPRCFGKHRDLGAAECQIVRRAVAVWTGAAKSSHHAWNVNLQCVPPNTASGFLPAKCRPPYERELYFQGRINHTLATSRY